MEQILLGTIIGFTALTVLLWWRLCVQTTLAETYHGDLNALRHAFDHPDSSFVLMPTTSTLNADIIQAAREIGKARKSAGRDRRFAYDIDQMASELDRLQASNQRAAENVAAAFQKAKEATNATKSFRWKVETDPARTVFFDAWCRNNCEGHYNAGFHYCVFSDRADADKLASFLGTSVFEIMEGR